VNLSISGCPDFESKRTISARTSPSPPLSKIAIDSLDSDVIAVGDIQQAQKHVEALQDLLDNALPAYMVPSVWIPVRNIPLNRSGKLERKRLQEWLSHLDLETYTQISNTGNNSTSGEHMTNSERVLRDSCSIVLNMPSANINLQRSFVANGGDSISAMRLSSLCRAANILFSVATLLRRKSLAEVAHLSTVITIPTISLTEDFDTAFSLSPIQKWFFSQSFVDQINTKGYHYNQAFYVKVRRGVSPDQISYAISRIVQQHSMLRARFQKVAGDWIQLVLKPSDGVYHFDSAHLQSLSDVESRTVQRHQELDIESGPVFAVDMYTLPAGDQYLIFIAHHLVVDLVSWRIILGDLEAFLTGRILQTGLPFQIWNQLQTERAKTSELDPQNVLSTEGICNNLEFWKFTQNIPNAVRDHEQESIEVDRHTTSLLLTQANRAFNTEPVDLLLSAIWDAFFSIFPRREDLTIFNEGHGREPWSAEIDLSRTVGWFTTISPIHITRAVGNSPANIARLVKDSRRRLPANGWAYFASRYLNSNGVRAFETHSSPMEVTFNYHGQFQQLERDDSLFDPIALENVTNVGPELPASTLFDINVSIENATTNFSFSWNRHLAHQDLIHQWIAQVGPSLRSICEDLASRKVMSTLCDYEFLDLDYKGLEDLQSRILPGISSANTDIENIYPCSPMVDGMLLNQIKHPASYNTSQIYEIRLPDLQKISLEALVEAWQAVIARHASLRTVFIEGMDKTSAFNQVVLKSYCGEVIMLYSQNEASALAMLRQLSPVNYGNLKPPHRLTLCQISDDSYVICQLEISHAITDGVSIAITLRDWAKAYSGTLRIEPSLDTARSFARTLKSNLVADKMAYWSNKLAGTEPCILPRISDISQPENGVSTANIYISGNTFTRIQEFCEEQSITPASLFQSAWALTLAAYTGTDSVCFAYLASGRDLPIDDIGESIGAYANLMVCCVDISLEWTSRRFVQHIHDQVLQDLGFQYCSLADIQHQLCLPSGQGLFNTIISCRKEEDSGTDDLEGKGLTFEAIEGVDLNEVITL
jgi:non-ribosomal peptide synthase protein (TIGR01720 family)